jgi:hypothetical protein
MVNTCVCCGDIIPEGSQVCYACSHYNILKCPDCGSAISLMSSCKSYTEKQVLFSRIYHCESCQADWEAESPANEPITKLKRKFWG